MHSQQASKESPSVPTFVAKRVTSGSQVLSVPVGAIWHGCTITEADHELEGRILAVDALAMSSYLRGEESSAIALSARLMALIRSRRPEVVLAWEAAERAWLDEGLDYFNSPASHGERFA